MLNPKLTTCTDCTTIQQLLIDIDLKMFKLSKDFYNNIVFMLNKSVKAGDIFDLLNYKRILTYKYYNDEYAENFTLEMVANKVKQLTSGAKENCLCEDDTTITITTTTTSSTSTTTTTTTVAPTTTTTTTILVTTTTTTTVPPTTTTTTTI